MENEFPASAGDWLKALVFPPGCLRCGKLVPPDRLFCRSCEDTLPENPQRRFIRLDNGLQMPVLSPFVYEGGYRETMLLYKFGGYRMMALRIGFLMAGLVNELPKWDWVVTHVPLSQEGLEARGYDQSELLAWQVARHNDMEMLRLLDKVKKTKTQHDLDLEERQTNLLGAYQALELAEGKNILLVDDIVTSGSTLKECAYVLLKAGARSLCCLCAADSSGRHADEGDDGGQDAVE